MLLVSLNPFPHDKNFDQTKLKEYADYKLNVTKMMIYVFDWVEKIVGKGEIACTSNFSCSPQCFQKASFTDPSKGVIVWEWVKTLITIPSLNDPDIEAYWKHCWTRKENADSQIFMF